ncbi:PIN domain-containing protein [Roseomonas sp. NAR14]|uniref:Ribonuclease VapC n=1 Tax=Roseomonas acroporae TaxID=2937791 RepID=A0A9X1Y6Q0_9PROT|nr:PIN domain-containing protein [Roseomonas acroporae]
MIVVDSSVWIANLRALPHEAVRCLHEPAVLEDVLVGDIVLTEVLQGARDEPHAARIERSLRQFPVVPMLGEALAPDAARHYRRMRGAGRTMNKLADLLIGTYCIAHGHALLHCDADFDAMEAVCGLRVLR